MNKERRKQLKEAVTLLTDAQEKIQEASSIVETCKDEEEESYDNLPEGVQDSERGEAMEENASQLDDAMSELESIGDSVGEQIDLIQEVIDRR